MSKDAYQSLTTYSGDLYGIKPSYQGIEYDFEVPANLVVASPGGIDSRTGHYTKGFYGRGNTSSDIYAGQGPRYIGGVYGNLYNSGQTASQAMGMYPANQDYQFYQNSTPQQYTGDPTSVAYEESWLPAQRIHEGANPPTSSIEGYDGAQTFIPPSGPDFEYVGETPTPSPTTTITNRSWPFVFVGVAFGFLFLMLWSKASEGFLVEFFNKSRPPSWKLYAVWMVFVGLIVGGMWYVR